jgi:hypothetical protein
MQARAKGFNICTDELNWGETSGDREIQLLWPCFLTIPCLSVDPNTAAAAAAITTAITTAATSLKTQARWLSLLSQVLVLGADLYQSHSPQIFPSSAPYPGGFPDVSAEMVSIFIDILDVAILIV